MSILVNPNDHSRTGEASTILFPKYEEFLPKEELEEEAELEEVEKAKDFKVGDMVQWNSSGGTARGKITRVVREGTVAVPESSFKIKAEPDNPAVLIRIYRDGEETETIVGHKMSTLRSSSMAKSQPTMGQVHQDTIMGRKKKKKPMMGYSKEDMMEDEEEDLEKVEFKQTPMKTEDGKRYPARAFAYVPDPEKPSTWKLRMWDTPTKKETPEQIGRAVAALSPTGFRGNRVQIPREDMLEVKRKVRQAWMKANRNKKDKPDLPREIK